MNTRRIQKALKETLEAEQLLEQNPATSVTISIKEFKRVLNNCHYACEAALNCNRAKNIKLVKMFDSTSDFDTLMRILLTNKESVSFEWLQDIAHSGFDARSGVTIKFEHTVFMTRESIDEEAQKETV